MSYLIYKHTNKLNGKSYIGQTSQKATLRWRNGTGYKESPIFYAAIQKYGFANFTHEILEENLATKELANQREQYWIAYYHTWIYDPDCNGYNSTQGGSCNNTTALQKKVFQLDIDGNILADFKSVSAAAIHFNVSPDRITRCCNKQKGYQTAGGYYWSFADNYAKVTSIQQLRRRRVVRLDSSGNEVIFNTVSEAAASIGVNRSLISRACKKHTQYHNYFWRYNDEERKNQN
jgi:hypothetical protein